jgi:hypothetical protein
MKNILYSSLFIFASLIITQSAKGMVVPKNINPIIEDHVKMLHQNGISIDNYFNTLMFEKRVQCLMTLQNRFNITSDEQILIQHLIYKLHENNPLYKKNGLTIEICDIEEVVLAKQLLKKHNINTTYINFIITNDPKKHSPALVCLKLINTKTGERIRINKNTFNLLLLSNLSSVQLQYEFIINIAMISQLSDLAKKMVIEHEIGHLVNGDLITNMVLECFSFSHGINYNQLKKIPNYISLQHCNEFHADLYALTHNKNNAQEIAESTLSIFNNADFEKDCETHPSPQKRRSFAGNFLEYLSIADNIKIKMT